MKTSTFFKRNLRKSLLLVITVGLFSFSQFNTSLEQESEFSKEVIAENAIAILATQKQELLTPPNMIYKDTDVLITVNTKDINERNIDSTVVFSEVDSVGTIISGSPKDFTSTVYKNMKISWAGVPKDATSNATIDIIDVRRKSDVSDNAKILKFSTKEKKNKKVEIKVKNKKIPGEEHYDVQIRIIYADNSTKTFWIDPKIKMN